MKGEQIRGWKCRWRRKKKRKNERASRLLGDWLLDCDGFSILLEGR